MSVFDSDLELQIMFDSLIEGFKEKGKSREWIEENLTGEVYRACEEQFDDQGKNNG